MLRPPSCRLRWLAAGRGGAGTRLGNRFGIFLDAARSDDRNHHRSRHAGRAAFGSDAGRSAAPSRDSLPAFALPGAIDVATIHRPLLLARTPALQVGAAGLGVFIGTAAPLANCLPDRAGVTAVTVTTVPAGPRPVVALPSLLLRPGRSGGGAGEHAASSRMRWGGRNPAKQAAHRVPSGGMRWWWLIKSAQAWGPNRAIAINQVSRLVEVPGVRR